MLGRILFTCVNAVFIIIGAAIWLFVLGPILWLPLLVRSITIYAVLLLVHAIVSTPIKGSTHALEAGIVWYFSIFFGMLAQVGDLMFGDFFAFDEAEPEGPNLDNLGWLEWFQKLALEVWALVKQAAEAIVFWTGIALLLSHFGLTIDIQRALAGLLRTFRGIL